ncbi:MAG: DUF308 domain-containing protein [Eubacteriales bacterium]|nr:DUF308 domain-containing protein [Eubacteriales bacterium]
MNEHSLKALTPISLLLRFLTFVGLGFWVLISPESLLRFLNITCVIALLINGVPSLFVSVFQKKEPHPHSFLSAVVSLLAAVLLSLFPKLLPGSVTIAVGVWSLLVGIIQIGYLLQLFVTKEHGKLRYILLTAFSLCSAALLLFTPSGTSYLKAYAGIYLILYGLWQLVDMIGILINRNVEDSRVLSHLRIRLPVLLTALLPSLWLRGLEKKQEMLTHDTVIHKRGGRKPTGTEELKVIFHLGKNVAFGFGHVDVSLRGQTISYGCYDENSNRLFGLLSDGVFMLVPTEPYLDYCRQAEGKLLVGFSLSISHTEGDNVKAAMERILKKCAPWQPVGRREYDLGAAFYKVQSGGFSVYNALRTNCCAMAELIASESGLCLLPPNGFVTPGSYFHFLEDELRDPESKVVKQTIYAKSH